MERVVLTQIPRSLDAGDVAGTQTLWHQHLCEGIYLFIGRLETA